MPADNSVGGVFLSLPFFPGPGKSEIATKNCGIAGNWFHRCTEDTIYVLLDFLGDIVKSGILSDNYGRNILYSMSVNEYIWCDFHTGSLGSGEDEKQQKFYVKVARRHWNICDCCCCRCSAGYIYKISPQDRNGWSSTGWEENIHFHFWHAREWTCGYPDNSHSPSSIYTYI